MDDALDDVARRLTAERFAPAPVNRPCGKKRWLSEQVARNYARLLELRYRDGLMRDVYQCELCSGDWHVTRVRKVGDE